MNLPTSFSYNFSLDSSVGQEPDRYALDVLREYPLPNDQVLARNPRNGSQMTLPMEVMNAMSHLTGFRTLDEHADELQPDGPANPQRKAAILNVLESLKKGGLLLSAEAVCKKLSPAATPQESAAKPVVAIITWERPAALRRLLLSLEKRCDLDAIDRVVVVDDSRSDKNGLQNRSITNECGTGFSCGLEYFGAAEAHALMHSLIGRLPTHESSIRFLLDRHAWKDHWTAGIARNYCQLLAAGKPLLVCDDDIICDVHEAPVDEDGVEITAQTREAVFYTDHESWPESASDDSPDPVSRHMQVLGRTIPQALQALDFKELPSTALRHCNAEFAGRLSRDSRVLVTECASIGDPGTGSNRWLATLPAASRDRLLANPSLLDSALRKRNCWLGRMQPALVAHSNMSQLTGSDNRDFLPPYLPVMRGQDRLFGDVCQFLFPDSVTLDLPWAVPHLPMPERSWRDQDNDFAVKPAFPGGLTAPPAELADRCGTAGLAGRLAFLADHYRDLATQSDNRLFEAWATDWQQSWSGLLTLLDEQVYAAEQAPTAWRDFVNGAYRQSRNLSLDKTGISELVSEELPLTGNDLASFWRRVWKGYGNSLLAWEAIRDAAHEIRNKPDQND